MGSGKENKPEAAFDFFSLNGTYHRDIAPDKTRAMAWMEPKFVLAIDSKTRRMGLEIKMKFAWEDDRIFWKEKDAMVAGRRFTFDPSVIRWRNRMLIYWL